MKLRLYMLAGCTLAFGLGPGASPAVAQGKDEQKIKLKERDGEFIKRVNTTVKRGVEWLKTNQLPDGAWADPAFDNHLHGSFRNGMVAFCLFTLLKAGVSPVDETCGKAFKYLRESWSNFKAGGMTSGEPTSWKNYEVSCMLMALAAKYQKPTAFVDSVQKGTPLAGFGGLDPGKLRQRPDREDVTWIQELAKFLNDHIGVTQTSSNGTSIVKERTTWSYPTANEDNLADRSNTQFVMLGLQAGDNLLRMAGGRPTTEAKIWQRVLQNFIQYQDPKPEKVVPRVVPFNDPKNPGYLRYRTIGAGGSNKARGWAYYTGKDVVREGDEWARPMGSITCVGVSVVAICMEQLQMWKKLGPADRKDATIAIRDGLAWLEVHYAIDKHPGHPPELEKKYLFYYLYGLERACVSADTPLIGTLDWYGDGAEYIMSRQEGEGQWRGDVESQVPTTCFALLFLTKGTVPPNIGVKISGH
jgi:hypothetical protein